MANYVFAFILVGLAWGFTTPFIRRAARSHDPPPHPILETPAVRDSWLKSKIYGAFFGVTDLLRNPRYAVPLLLNLTGSVWFFLLIGQAGASGPFVPLLRCVSLFSVASVLMMPIALIAMGCSSLRHLCCLCPHPCPFPFSLFPVERAGMMTPWRSAAISINATLARGQSHPQLSPGYALPCPSIS